MTGGDRGELEGDGVFLDHAQRYEQSAEFIRIWRGILARSHDGEGLDYEGEHLQVKGARLLFPPVQKPYPPVYFGGSSEAAHELAASQVDAYLTWGEPPAEVARKIADVRARAARHGRTVKFGIRLHVIVRETDEAAWAAAEELIGHVTDETVVQAQAAFARMDSEGQRRMAALHAQGARRSRADLEISPNLWAGVGTVRGGAGTALVGDPQTVAARIEEYARLGIDTFVLSGYPHLEEAYRFAELVFPLLPLRTREARGRRALRPVRPAGGRGRGQPVRAPRGAELKEGGHDTSHSRTGHQRGRRRHRGAAGAGRARGPRGVCRRRGPAPRALARAAGARRRVAGGLVAGLAVHARAARALGRGARRVGAHRLGRAVDAREGERGLALAGPPSAAGSGCCWACSRARCAGPRRCSTPPCRWCATSRRWR